MASTSSIKVNSINQGLPPTIDLPFECIDSIQVKQPIAIHLFSNILDIPTIELKRLAEILSSSGLRHYVLCIGPAFRNEDRINAFCLNFNDNKAKYIEFDNRTDE